MKRFSLLLIALAAVFLIGCSTPKEPTVQQQASDKVADVDNLGDGLTGLDILDQDLDTSDLDGLEDDLNVDF